MGRRASSSLLLVLRNLDQGHKVLLESLAQGALNQSFKNAMYLQLPKHTKTMFFCRLPINSIYGFIIRTYTNDGYGGQW